MKTMETRLNQIIFTAFLVVLSLTVSAGVNGTELYGISGLEKTEEVKLSVEGWMVTGHHWDTNQGIYNIGQDVDPVFKIESWMLDEDNWLRENYNIPVIEESEKQLQVEDWMINGSYWKQRKGRFIK